MRPTRPAARIWRHASKQSITQASGCLQHSCHQRSLHASTNLQRRSPYKSISHAELQRLAKERSPSYTSQDKAELAIQYNAEQLAIIDEAEKAIDPQDLVVQARLRSDHFGPEELDDWSRIHETVDKKVERIQGDPFKYEQIRSTRQLRKMNHVKTPEEMLASMASAMMKLPESERAGAEPWERLQSVYRDKSTQNNADIAGTRIIGEPRREGEKRIATPADYSPTPSKDYSDRWKAIYGGSERSKKARKSSSAPEEIRLRLAKILSYYNPPEPDVAPALSQIQDDDYRFVSDEEHPALESMDDATAEAYSRLSKQTGEAIDRLLTYRTKTLVQHRVVNQTRLGKIASMYYLVVAGDGGGMVGLGEGKADEMDEAKRIATLNAIRAMKPIPRYESRTIYGEVESKVGAVRVILNSRPPGFGLRVSSHVFEIARAAGISDLSARVPRSRNPMNVCKAVWQALLNQPDPEQIAIARGLKLVDVRKVYYAGAI